MVNEQIFTDQGHIHVARCIHCGDVLDGVVIANRRYPTGMFTRKVFKGMWRVC